MDLLSLMRTLGGLGVVLGILAAALWVVRRYDLRLPGRTVSALDRRLELVETLSIDARRMVALVRRDGREHVILIAPEGHLVLESAVVRDPAELAAERARDTARVEADRLHDEQRTWRRQLRAAAAAAQIKRLAASWSRAHTRVGLAIYAIEKRTALLPSVVAVLTRDRLQISAATIKAIAAFANRPRGQADRHRHRFEQLTQVPVVQTAVLKPKVEPPPGSTPASAPEVTHHRSASAYIGPNTKRARRRRRRPQEKQVA